MVDDRLLNYIKEKQKSGYSDDVIKQALLKFGYSNQILATFFQKKENIQPKQPINEQPNFLNKTFYIFSKPFKLFEIIKEESKKQTITYFITLISIIFTIILLTELYTLFIKQTDYLIYILTVILMTLLFIVVFVTISTGFAFLYKLLLKSFGTVSFFKDNLKIVAYSLIPYFLIISFIQSPIYKWLLVIDVSFGFISLNPYLIFSFFILSKGIEKYYNISRKKALLFAYVPLIMLILVLFSIFFNALTFKGWFF